jgi:hypothetical protein
MSGMASVLLSKLVHEPLLSVRIGQDIVKISRG